MDETMRFLRLSFLNQYALHSMLLSDFVNILQEFKAHKVRCIAG